MHLEDFIVSYKNFVSKHECNLIIDAFEERSNYVKEYESDTFKFDQLWLNECDLTNLGKDLVKRMTPLFNDYFKTLNVDQYIGIEGLEFFRIKKYYKNSNYEFKPHFDAIGPEQCKRYLVAILYLNDNNGSTIFPQLNYQSKPETGKLILFPPTWQYIHAGLNPTDNDKYILMTYLNFV